MENVFDALKWRGRSWFAVLVIRCQSIPPARQDPRSDSAKRQ
jgi:hypothetical protein